MYIDNPFHKHKERRLENSHERNQDGVNKETVWAIRDDSSCETDTLLERGKSFFRNKLNVYFNGYITLYSNIEETYNIYIIYNKYNTIKQLCATKVN